MDTLMDVKGHRRILGDFSCFEVLNRYGQRRACFLKIVSPENKKQVYF